MDVRTRAVETTACDDAAGVTATLRGLAEELLRSGEVSVVIGYAEGWDPGKPVPCFARKPQQAGKLIFDERCAISLVKYILEYAAAPGGGPGRVVGAGAAAAGRSPRAAVVLKGCDSLGLMRLVMDKRIDRGSVYAIGVRCRGMAAGAVGGQGPAAKCVGCRNAEPVGCDIVIGEPVPPELFGVRDLSRVDALESAGPDERYDYWSRQMERCIRCYACRNICPACHCKECSLEPSKGPWLTQERTISEQAMYHFARVFHVAGRCTDCGECERVCPVGLPLMDLNRKVMRDIGRLFGIDRPEVPAETEPLGRYASGDPEEIM